VGRCLRATACGSQQHPYVNHPGLRVLPLLRLWHWQGRCLSGAVAVLPALRSCTTSRRYRPTKRKYIRIHLYISIYLSIYPSSIYPSSIYQCICNRANTAACNTLALLTCIGYIIYARSYIVSLLQYPSYSMLTCRGVFSAPAAHAAYADAAVVAAAVIAVVAATVSAVGALSLPAALSAESRDAQPHPHLHPPYLHPPNPHLHSPRCSHC
jgi:hypothetical protein